MKSAVKRKDCKMKKLMGNIKANLGFEMIIKIILMISVLIFFLFLATGARESMLEGIRKIFTFGR